MSEEDLNFILDDLSGDHSYYRFQMDKVREYIRYFQKIENYFLCKKIDCLREELIISLKNLDNFLALKFFVYPENQTMDNIRFCLQPDLNIDRAGEPSEYTFTEYEKLTKALESRCNEVYEKYKEYRLQVKRMLMI